MTVRNPKFSRQFEEDLSLVWVSHSADWCVSKNASVYFFLNNQPDALIIQIYSVIKLYMFQASSLPIIRSFLLYIQHWHFSCRFLMTASKQSQDRTPDDGQRRCLKLVEFYNRINLDNWCVCLVI